MWLCHANTRNNELTARYRKSTALVAPLATIDIHAGGGAGTRNGPRSRNVTRLRFFFDFFPFTKSSLVKSLAPRAREHRAINDNGCYLVTQLHAMSLPRSRCLSHVSLSLFLSLPHFLSFYLKKSSVMAALPFVSISSTGNTGTIMYLDDFHVTPCSCIEVPRNQCESSATKRTGGVQHT